METKATITERLERCFDDIHAERMRGIPILNQALHVKAIGMHEWQGQWLCVLLTPWFMNVMLLPVEAHSENPTPDHDRVGTKKSFIFPAGQFEFIRGDEPSIGAYWMCSLFSPVLEFADQETAEAAAEAALEAMLGEAEEASEHEQEMAMIWQGELPDRNVATKDQIPIVEVEKLGPTSQPDEASGLSRRAFLSGKEKEANS